MTLDDLAGKTIIEFVRPLNFRESMDLLEYIAEDSTIVDTSYIGKFRGSFISIGKNGEKIKPRDVRVCYELQAIFRISDERATLGWRTNIAEFLDRPPGEYRKKSTISKALEQFYGMRFLVPELIDLEFVERVRQGVDDYFKKIQ